MAPISDRSDKAYGCRELAQLLVKQTDDGHDLEPVAGPQKALDLYRACKDTLEERYLLCKR